MEGMILEPIFGVGAVLLMLGYHVFLCYKVQTCPFHTTIGAINHARHLWVLNILHENVKANQFPVQTLRNSIMEVTLMATVGATLTAAIAVYVTFTARYQGLVDELVSGAGADGDGWAVPTKPGMLIGCFMFSFLCNAQSARFLNTLNFLLNVGPQPKAAGADAIEDGTMGGEEELANLLQRATLLNTVGSRSLYFGACLLLWVFGPLPFFGFTLALIPTLYMCDFLHPKPIAPSISPSRTSSYPNSTPPPLPRLWGTSICGRLSQRT